MYFFTNLVERIKKAFEKYQNAVDTIPTPEKITLLHAELEDIHQLASQLDRI